MKHRISSSILVGLTSANLALSACATIVEGTSQTVTVTTDPPGATCELSRGTEVISVVNATPGSVVVDKSKDDISVTCEKEGYESGSSTLSSEFQGMTFGNLIFGGLIGVAIDAGSGAMHEYRPSVAIVMAPEQFPSAQARDEFYSARMAAIEDDAAEAIAKIEKNCPPTDASRCRNAVIAVEKEGESQLAEIEVKRATAKVAGN